MEPNKMIRESIGNLVEGSHLSHQEAFVAMTEIISGSATDTQIGAFLTALAINIRIPVSFLTETIIYSTMLNST